MHHIGRYTDEIRALCEQYHVSELYVFGSATQDNFGAESDIDLVVEFFPIPLQEYADNYLNFKDSLEKVTGRKVDLVELQAIHNPVFLRIIQRDRKLLYARTAA